jgi:hypothetical protein
MKYLKRISVVIILIVSITLFIFGNSIDIFAKSMGTNEIEIGHIFKNGDTIKFGNTFDPCEVNAGLDPNDCREYSYITFYYLEDQVLKEYPEINNFAGEDSFGLGDATENELEINNDFSEYWKLLTFNTSSGGVHFYFVPIEYQAPVFKLFCDPSEIKKGEYSDCTFSTKALYNFKGINFELEADDYEIIEVEAGDKFENLEEIF